MNPHSLKSLFDSLNSTGIIYIDKTGKVTSANNFLLSNSKGELQELILNPPPENIFNTCKNDKMFTGFVTLQGKYSPYSLKGTAILAESDLCLLVVERSSQEKNHILGKILKTHDKINKMNQDIIKENIKFKHNLEKMLTDKDKLLNKVNETAHDLKAPLFTIKGFSQLLDEALGDTSEEIKKYLNFIITSSSKMSDFIDKQLKASSETENIDELPELDLSEIREELNSTFSLEVDKSNLLIEFKGEKSVNFKKHELLKILKNLVSNSLTHSGVSPVKVTIDFENMKSGFKLKYCDNGKGVEPSMVEKIKAKNYTSNKNENNGKSHGLGLFLIEEIVNSNSGNFDIISDPGNGFKCTIFIASSLL